MGNKTNLKSVTSFTMGGNNDIVTITRLIYLCINVNSASVNYCCTT